MRRHTRAARTGETTAMRAFPLASLCLGLGLITVLFPAAIIRLKLGLVRVSYEGRGG